uniref:VPS37 C-terminal domain-containing protein n=1 Tax=Caenorhabditis japonica TaxID=281687 RepID=A0A8R1HMM8_CAEJA
MSSNNNYEYIIDLAISTAANNLRILPTEQLAAILDDEKKLESIIESLPQIRSMPTDREFALAANKSLAEWNLTQKPRIDELKKQTVELYDRAKNLQMEVNSLKTQLDSISSSKSLDTTSNLMQVAAQEADDDAESLSNNLENGELSIELFLKQFKEAKKLAHLRKIKSDRLAGLLREPTSQAPTFHQPGYPSANYAPALGSIPFGSGYPNVSQMAPGRHPFS